jgi:hypothetical protein
MTQVNPFFNVTREPAYATFNGVQVDTNRDALLDEKGSLLGLVSRSYNMVDNKDVKLYFDEAFDGFKVEKVEDHLSNNGSKWVREIVFGDDEFVREIVPGDAVNLKLKVWNGYDGKTAVGFGLEAYRQVCTNGMMGWGSVFSTSIAHVGNNVIDVIKNTFNNKFQNYVTVFDKMQEWTKKPFTFKDFETFVSDKIKDEVKTDTKVVKVGYLSEKQAKGIMDLYPVVMNQYNEKENVWGAYNVLTAIATHHTATKSSNSHLFTHGYKRMTRLTEDFVNTVG